MAAFDEAGEQMAISIPKNVIYYRDGVSDPAFPRLLEEEWTSLKEVGCPSHRYIMCHIIVIKSVDRLILLARLITAEMIITTTTIAIAMTFRILSVIVGYF